MDSFWEKKRESVDIVFLPVVLVDQGKRINRKALGGLTMRKAEKKRLLEKLTVFIGKKIEYKNSVEGWTDREVAEECGVPQNRLTEIKNFKKYNRAISEVFLAAFIESRIVTVKEILGGVELMAAEKDYVKTMEFFQKPGLKDGVLRHNNAGVDVVAVLDMVKEAGDAGIDIAGFIKKEKERIANSS